MKPNSDVFKTLESHEVGVIGGLHIAVEVWENRRDPNDSRWVCMLSGQQVREHFEIQDEVAGLMLRCKEVEL